MRSVVSESSRWDLQGLLLRCQRHIDAVHLSFALHAAQEDRSCLFVDGYFAAFKSVGCIFGLTQQVLSPCFGLRAPVGSLTMDTFPPLYRRFLLGSGVGPSLLIMFFPSGLRFLSMLIAVPSAAAVTFVVVIDSLGRRPLCQHCACTFAPCLLMEETLPELSRRILLLGNTLADFSELITGTVASLLFDLRR
jgi:hypothetical protein